MKTGKIKVQVKFSDGKVVTTYAPKYSVVDLTLLRERMARKGEARWVTFEGFLCTFCQKAHSLRGDAMTCARSHVPNKKMKMLNVETADESFKEPTFSPDLSEEQTRLLSACVVRDRVTGAI